MISENTRIQLWDKGRPICTHFFQEGHSKQTFDLDLQEGYDYVKDHCAQTAHQPGKLLKEKGAIHWVEENAQTISDIAEDWKNEHMHRETLHRTAHELDVCMHVFVW